MKERKLGIRLVWCYGCLLIPLALSPPTIAQTGTEVKGWDVDQEMLVNLFNNQSPLEMSNEMRALPLSDENLLPVFHSLKVTSPEMYGLRGAATITHSLPTYGNFNKLIDHRSAMQLQAKASYSSSFEKGNVNFWLGALWKQQEINSIVTGIQANEGNFGYNVGIDVNYADFGLTGTYYNGQALDNIYYLPYQAFDSSNCIAGLCSMPDNQGYILKGTYAFTKATKFGISYGESNGYNHMMNAAESGNELWSVGLYHDVNSWFKITAEYRNFKSSNYGYDDTSSDMISVGGYIRW